MYLFGCSALFLLPSWHGIIEALKENTSCCRCRFGLTPRSSLLLRTANMPMSLYPIGFSLPAHSTRVDGYADGDYIDKDAVPHLLESGDETTNLLCSMRMMLISLHCYTSITLKVKLTWVRVRKVKLERRLTRRGPMWNSHTVKLFKN